MKKTTFITLILGIIINYSFAQNAKLTVNFLNSDIEKCTLTDWKLSLRYDYLNMGDKTINIIKDKPNTLIINLKEPRFYTLFYQGKTKDISYKLYIRPSDEINFTADFDKPDSKIKVTGKGSENNQPLIGLSDSSFDIGELYGDTLPTRILASLKQQESEKDKIFKTYLSQFKPSKDFIKNWKINQHYFIPNEYFSFKENNKFQISKSYKNTEREWKRIQDSLFKIDELNNDKLFVSDQYTKLIADFLNREKERLWNASYADSTAFYKEWYNTTPSLGKLEFQKDMTNLLSEKIINKYFSNKSAEYLYAVLLEDAIKQKDHQNIPEIYERFKDRFPANIYLEPFKPHIEKIIKKQKNTITDKMVFAKNNGTTLNTFEELIALNKGKTMLLDMWGTWCGPCRQEIEKNSAAIKKHFKDKDLGYLYVANKDVHNEAIWKNLIPYFEMEGFHVLANQKLSKDIMEKVKGTGYPTYVIIKKDGSYERSKAGYPMERKILIKQLEEALAVE